MRKHIFLLMILMFPLMAFAQKTKKVCGEYILEFNL